MKRYSFFKKLLKNQGRNRKHIKDKKKTDNAIQEVESFEENNLDNIALATHIEENYGKLQQIFKNCSDIVLRKLTIGKVQTQCLLVYLDGMVKKDTINENVLKPLMLDPRITDVNGSVSTKCLADVLKNTSISTGEIKEITSMKEAVNHILKGACLLYIDTCKYALAIEAKGWESRSISQPEAEPVVRGPREAFTEDISVNTTMIRRRIKSTNLKIEKHEIGRLSKTDVIISYVAGIADEGILNEIRRRLNRIDIDIILESGYIEQLIEDNPFSPFPEMEVTERPDVVVGALAEGRYAIFVDGSPFVLLVPTVFIHFFTAPEDYYVNFYFATFLRFLRYFALLIALFGPSLYIALTTFHQEMIPTSLLISITASRAEVPFPSVVEALLMEITFEILREAGIRLPRPVGQAVSIVGALVIGETAVDAGIVSHAMVIVVAITGIASFMLPKYNMGISIRLLRFPIMFLAAFLGIFGIIMGALVILIYLASMRSFGIPYLSPLAPIKFKDWRDFIIKLPLRSMQRRPEFIQKNNLIRMKERLKQQPPKANKE